MKITPSASPPLVSAALSSQAEALLAFDFLETVTITGARMYVLAVIEHHTHRIRVPDATSHPTAAWVTQAGAEPGHGPGGCQLPGTVVDQ
jgi:hypothetical protein